MEKIYKRKLFIAILALIFFACGCGYTTRSLLPPNFKTIYIENFKNDIRVTAEQSNLRMYRGYRPGLEIDITRAVVSKFLQDGNLRIGGSSDSDLILKGGLLDFKRDALRYDANDNIEEYRIKLVVSMQLENPKTGTIVWAEKGFAGETTYRTSGGLARSESAALNDAIDDLARRIVERTIEAW